jgi:hypothetical protein
MLANITLARLNKEEFRMSKNPIKNAIVKRKGILNFYLTVTMQVVTTMEC